MMPNTHYVFIVYVFMCLCILNPIRLSCALIPTYCTGQRHRAMTPAHTAENNRGGERALKTLVCG